MKNVLLTNDDGYFAPGIRALQEELRAHYNVVVVAPEKEQSGVGHAFTFHNPLHYRKFGEEEGAEGFSVSGSPADCVKFSLSYLLSSKPDIIVSGMNIGENSGLSAFYSGTVAAAREGAFWGIPSFAFSLCSQAKEYAKEYAKMVPSIINKVLDSEHQQIPLDTKVFYNVNFPPCSPTEIKGTRVTYQSMAFFDDRYEKVEVLTHHTKEGYMIYGEKKDIETWNTYDSRALMNKYITITPLTFDSTAHWSMPHLRWLEDSGSK
ncbi:5'/3'-nucleotidase SurE [Chitinispirillales bacterium ANBcel5]|uniref:5'/3'-nucleotidase SurE n=1 Tax=Cellulosispirillum alkaliphilum TaxID=3039283 RepID=UPI002A545F1C|nr:5'/3'-nucleotidase SurE [Chitinispirillales bacterium ANBcel5]